MAEKTTFIKLDRNIERWRWYKNANTMRVFLHLLLNANVTDHDFEAITIHRGEVATSYKSIADALDLTVQEVRTAISHLKSTGELTGKKYPKFQVLSMVRYSMYQSTLTGKQQAKNLKNCEQNVNETKKAQKSTGKSTGSTPCGTRDCGQSATGKSTGNQHSTNRQATFNQQQYKNVKNDKKEKNIGGGSALDAQPPAKGTPEYDAWRNQ